jgi:plastocyanin
VHTLAVQLAPVLAAEKSKVPFYIAGGLLVGWALIVSLALGLRNPDFPGNLVGQRTVSAITAVLVLAALSTAVITSGSPAKPAAAAPAQTTTTGSEAPAPAATSSTTAATSTPAASTPAATAPAATTPAATTHTASTPAAPSPTATTNLALAADAAGALLYNTKSLSAKAGTVTIRFTNGASVEHNLTIAQGATVLGATPTFAGGSHTLTVKLKPGSYSFYCSVPGHPQAGMEGTLTIS